MESKGSCARCTHPVYHEPLWCKHCKGGFCLYCFARDNACVQCHDEVDLEHAVGVQQEDVEEAWSWAEHQEKTRTRQRFLQYDQLVFGACCVLVWTCWYFL